MCERTRTRVVREGARVRALIGEGNGKVGRKEKESGGGSEEDGVIVGRTGVNRAMRVEEGGEERENPNWKSLHAVQKGSAEGETRNIPRKIVRSRTRNEERREKSGLHRAKKRGRFLEKVPEIGFETEKSGKNGDFGAKKEG